MFQGHGNNTCIGYFLPLSYTCSNNKERGKYMLCWVTLVLKAMLNSHANGKQHLKCQEKTEPFS